jgi:hypothetical protein
VVAVHLQRAVQGQRGKEIRAVSAMELHPTLPAVAVAQVAQVQMEHKPTTSILVP